MPLAAPHGTSGAHRTTFSPGSARSARSETGVSASGGVTITRVFVAKMRASETSSAIRSKVCSFAVATMSGAAPSSICVTSTFEPSVTIGRMSTSGCSASKAAAISSKAPCSDAAANTVTGVPSPSAGPAHPASSTPDAAAVAATRRLILTRPSCHQRRRPPVRPSLRRRSGGALCRAPADCRGAVAQSGTRGWEGVGRESGIGRTTGTG